LERGEGCGGKSATDVAASGVALFHAVERVIAEDEPAQFTCQMAFGENELGRMCRIQRHPADYR
jgi:hypothetical protein